RDDQIVRLSLGVEADGDLRELGHPDREVDVSERVVGQPASTVAARILTVDRAAVVKASVKALRAREVRVEAAVHATELRPREARDEERRGHEDGKRPDPHAPTVYPAWPSLEESPGVVSG